MLAEFESNFIFVLVYYVQSTYHYMCDLEIS